MEKLDHSIIAVLPLPDYSSLLRINRQRGSEKESDNQNGETEGKQTGEKPAREK